MSDVDEISDAPFELDHVRPAVRQPFAVEDLLNSFHQSRSVSYVRTTYVKRFGEGRRPSQYRQIANIYPHVSRLSRLNAAITPTTQHACIESGNTRFHLYAIALRKAIVHENRAPSSIYLP